MTATATDPPEAEPWLQTVHPTYRVVVRWAFIGLLTVAAFHKTLMSLIQVTLSGVIGGYVWTVVLAGILAAIGVARRERTELPIHDRQTDIIIGTMGLVFALLLQAVLLQRYAMYFFLLRLDVVAMWMFVVSTSVVLFGLRPVARFWRVWVLLLMVFPLPYYIVVAVLGGTKYAAAAATLLIAGSATGVAVGRTRRRGYVGAFAAWGVGLAALGLMAVLVPDSPVFAYMQIPALVAIVLVGMVMYAAARRGTPKRMLDRKVEPLAVKQVWLGMPLVAAVAIALAFVNLPIMRPPPPARFDAMPMGYALTAPAGWESTDLRDYSWVARLHGAGAHMIRQTMVADMGNPQWDKQSRPRTVIVDSLTTYRPFTLMVYPSKVLYNVRQSRLSTPHTVDLGYGVTAQMVSVVDDDLFVTWNMLQWTWRNGEATQRVLVFAVDNHDANAPFPPPNGAMWPTLSTLVTVLFRGNSAVTDRDPMFKDADLLTSFGRGLVRAQIEAMS
ncbi:MAG: hypothetical protein JWR11_5432 [Mycobacterium sp.]|jgi:hypothetical protein|nr:hypothetical protein [Mycobacterium sp.]